MNIPTDLIIAIVVYIIAFLAIGGLFRLVYWMDKRADERFEKRFWELDRKLIEERRRQKGEQTET